VLASCAKGESWLLSDCCAVDVALLVLLEFCVIPALCRVLKSACCR